MHHIASLPPNKNFAVLTGNMSAVESQLFDSLPAVFGDDSGA